MNQRWGPLLSYLKKCIFGSGKMAVFCKASLGIKAYEVGIMIFETNAMN